MPICHHTLAFMRMQVRMRIVRVCVKHACANASAHENCASVRETCVRARGWGEVGIGVRLYVGVARAHIAQNDHATKLGRLLNVVGAEWQVFQNPRPIRKSRSAWCMSCTKRGEVCTQASVVGTEGTGESGNKIFGARSCSSCSNLGGVVMAKLTNWSLRGVLVTPGLPCGRGAGGGIHTMGA